jgi:hypothetical protein
MSRRADPARIDEARKAATRNRLIGEHIREATADARLAAWAEQAASDGLERGVTYWNAPRGQRARPLGSWRTGTAQGSHPALLERLAQRLEHVAVELRQLVKNSTP